MTFADVKATIRHGIQALDESRTMMKQVNAELADVSALALATLTGSDHQLANKARSELAEAKREIELVLRRLDTAKDEARAFLSMLG